jgi:type I restriction enzyme S subunit
MSERLPSGWKLDRLDAIAELERATVLPQDIREGTKYVGLEHIDSSGAFLDVPEVEQGELASNKFAFSEQHVLYGKLRPYLTKIARPEFAGVCSTEIIPIRTNGRLIRDYLYFFLRQPRMVALANARTAGANLPRLSPTDLASFPIAYPESPTEQRRIADILDEADALRRKRANAIRLANDLVPSLFYEMFGDPVSNPKRWPLKPLGEYVTFITSGSRGWAEHYVAAGKRFIRSLDVQMNEISNVDPCYVDPPSGPEAERTRVKDGDVLLTITGSKVGRVTFVPTGFGEAYVSQHVAILRLKTELRPRFLSMFLSLPNGGQLQIKKAQYGQTKPGLSLEQIRNFAIPWIAPELQDRFCGTWSAYDAVSADLNNSNCDLDNLFHSLLQRAFRGEL